MSSFVGFPLQFITSEEGVLIPVELKNNTYQKLEEISWWINGQLTRVSVSIKSPGRRQMETTLLSITRILMTIDNVKLLDYV